MLPCPAGWHEFAEFTADDVGTVDSGLNSMVRRAVLRCAAPCCAVLCHAALSCAGVLSRCAVTLCWSAAGPAAGGGGTAPHGPCRRRFVPLPCCQSPSLLPLHQVMANNNEMILLPVNEPTFGTKRCAAWRGRRGGGGGWAAAAAVRERAGFAFRPLGASFAQFPFPSIHYRRFTSPASLPLPPLPLLPPPAASPRPIPSQCQAPVSTHLPLPPPLLPPPAASPRSRRSWSRTRGPACSTWR